MSGAKRLLFAAAILTPAALLVFVGSNSQPLRAEPTKILDIAMTGYAKGEFDPFVGKPFGGSLINLRGVREEVAKGLLSACSEPADWVLLGDEHSDTQDRGDFPNAIMQCQQDTGALVVRLWTERWKVDRLTELAYRSEFVACAPGQCPDFMVGDEPRPSGVRPFKIQAPTHKK